jgi:hypothetical protein
MTSKAQKTVTKNEERKKRGLVDLHQVVVYATTLPLQRLTER